MSLSGYDSHGERLTTLVTEARKLLSSTSPSALISNGHSTDDEGHRVKEKLTKILDDAHEVATGLDRYVEHWCVDRLDRTLNALFETVINLVLLILVAFSIARPSPIQKLNRPKFWTICLLPQPRQTGQHSIKQGRRNSS